MVNNNNDNSHHNGNKSNIMMASVAEGCRIPGSGVVL